jgi:protein-disulfide isomerase
MRQLLLALSLIQVVAAQQAPVEGNPKSSVRVIIYEDLQCSDCAVFRRIMDEALLPKYASSVAFEHRDFPLEKHKWARKAAIAARYVGAQNPQLGVKFRQFCFSNQQALTPENFDTRLSAFAKEHGIAPDGVRAALGDAKLTALVEEDYQDGIARGVARTPTVYVDGTAFVEPSTPDEIVKALDQALSRKK